MRNPLEVVATIVASMHDAKGRVAIEGFYDDVRRASAQERAALRASMPGAETLGSEFNVRPFGEPDFTTAERIALRPALIVTDIWAGDAAEKGGIPRRAGARLTARIVPDQNVVSMAAIAIRGDTGSRRRSAFASSCAERHRRCSFPRSIRSSTLPRGRSLGCGGGPRRSCAAEVRSLWPASFTNGWAYRSY